MKNAVIRPRIMAGRSGNGFPQSPPINNRGRWDPIKVNESKARSESQAAIWLKERKSISFRGIDSALCFCGYTGATH